MLPALHRLDATRFDTPQILKRLAASSRQLAELKGVAATIPNQGILINSLGLQEAKDSSEIENIVTTHDELFREAIFPDSASSAAAKDYRAVMAYLYVYHRHPVSDPQLRERRWQMMQLFSIPLPAEVY